MLHSSIWCTRLCFRGASRRTASCRLFSIYHGGLPRDVKAGRVTHYEVLQLREDADDSAIKQAYLRLVKLHHPDASKDPDSAAVFLCIKEAHETLSDPSKRREYDSELSRSRSPFGNASQSFARPLGARGTGFDADAARAERERERFERYSRYVRGESTDKDEPFFASKMLGALGISCVSVFLLCMFAEEFTNRFNGIGEEDDLQPGPVNDRRLARVYFNPVTDRWERVIAPFVAPSPSALLEHYRELADEDFDEQAMAKALPKREFPTIELPFSQTHRPSLLYDPRTCKLVVFKD